MGIKRAVVNELTVSVLVMSSLSTYQSGHTFGLDIRETGGSTFLLPCIIITEDKGTNKQECNRTPVDCRMRMKALRGQDSTTASTEHNGIAELLSRTVFLLHIRKRFCRKWDFSENRVVL
ncbi:hypothetical protein Anapl_01270 [Anas platyrhynchos]|uniref:Uncharacterized protein n=1 Tax=Anas platyrhynchos TaxID=8839 RepID=R0K7N6_ANAPL|nr:hypothetical protein Anapl_01270 [Anas platyrhynchos]